MAMADSTSGASVLAEAPTVGQSTEPLGLTRRNHASLVKSRHLVRGQASTSSQVRRRLRMGRKGQNGYTLAAYAADDHGAIGSSHSAQSAAWPQTSAV